MAEIGAPMSGKILKIDVNIGDQVSEDEEVALLEAMKMEIPVVSSYDGRVKDICVKTGDSVEEDDILIVLD